MTINRSARPLVLFAIVAASIGYLVCGLHCAWPLIAIAVLLLYVFRDPRREIPALPLAIVSPVDGRVQTVSVMRDPYLGRDAIRITLHMPWWGPYVTRSPTEGKICHQWYLPRGLHGGDLKADAAAIAADAAPREARYAMMVRTDERDEVTLALRGPWIAQRLLCLMRPGQRIGQGQRFGLLRFAGKVDVYVPAGSRVAVEPGGKVRAGSDIIATLVHRTADDVRNEVSETP